jgi:hypothetical protein
MYVILQRLVSMWYLWNTRMNLEQTVHLIVRDHFEDSGIFGIIILKGIIYNYDIIIKNGLIQLKR